MARVEKPLMAQRARGKLGGGLVYEVWHGVNYVKKNQKPSNPRTEKQNAQRGYYSEAIELYRNSKLTQKDKLAWEVAAKRFGGNMSAYNAWMKECLFNLRKGWQFKPLYNGRSEVVSENEIKFLIDSLAGQTIYAILFTRGFSIIEYYPMNEHGSGEYNYTFTDCPKGRLYFSAEYLVPLPAGKSGYYLHIN